MKSFKEIIARGSSIGRVEYLAFGIVVPLMIVGISLFINEMAFVYSAIFAIILYFYFSVKRARDTKYRTGRLIFWLCIPYISLIPTLILLFQPHGEKKIK